MPSLEFSTLTFIPNTEHRDQSINQSIIMFIRCKRVMHIKYVAERFANWRQRKDQLVIKVSCHHQTNSLLSRYDCFDMKTKTEQKQKQKKKKSYLLFDTNHYPQLNEMKCGIDINEIKDFFHYLSEKSYSL